MSVAQNGGPTGPVIRDPRSIDANVPIDASEIQSIMTDQPDPTPPGAAPSGIDLLTLISRGGAFMIPIGIMSFLVVALAVERFASLRRRRIIPMKLRKQLAAMLDPISKFDPTAAYHACIESPSPASRVIMAMLRRTGQPLADIERAASETIEREADHQASPIRWLTLAAAATPLMGLLGTVWGMIVAFHESTTLTADRSRSEQLSEGIYTALVTTLAGLVVAIPAAMLALYLENRLIKLFHRIEQLSFDVAPGLARFTGRRQMNSDGTLRMHDTLNEAPPAPPLPKQTGKSRDQAKTG
ncbi:MotA/TolQ/ExbB proton channel family protein [Rubripirellula lacrimiformis]|uniref:MotA/TolQ/ExbB proton channel family protein n=1 Tax=Rubripirellula lacrimiformis TaxID=1930273 RepID=UPI001FE909AB|nr:MotA/TolQ/ExbB proton channel family protein [Rubripirellula lacrimiformis]